MKSSEFRPSGWNVVFVLALLCGIESLVIAGGDSTDAPKDTPRTKPGSEAEKGADETTPPFPKTLTKEDEQVLGRLREKRVISYREDEARELAVLLRLLSDTEVVFIPEGLGRRVVKVRFADINIEEALNQLAELLGNTWVIRNNRVLVGSQEALQKASESKAPVAPGGGQEKELEISYDRARKEITLTLRNLSDKSILVDKELVFYVGVSVKDRDGKDISHESMTLIAKPPVEELQKRFVAIPPGKTVARKVGLTTGYKYFQSGYITTLRGMHEPLIGWNTPAEYTIRYAETVEPSRIEVTYALDYRNSTSNCLYNYIHKNPIETGVFKTKLSATWTARAADVQ